MSASAARLRDALWSAQEGRCWICDAQMRLRGLHNKSSSLDHLWPKALYGNLGDVGITLLAHRFCNNVRGPQKPTDDDVRKLVSVYRRMPRPYLRHHFREASNQIHNGGYWPLRRGIIAALLGDHLEGEAA